MTARNLIILIVLAITGNIAVSLIFPSSHSAAKWNMQLDRSRALELARAEAARQNLNTTGWLTEVETLIQRNSEAYLNHTPDPVIAAHLSRTVSRVTYADPSSQSEIQVSLASDGRVIGWDRKLPKGEETESPPNADATRAAAEAALADLTGAAKSLFSVKSQDVPDAEGREYSWEMTVPTESRVRIAVVTKVQRGIVTEAAVNTIFSREYLDAANAARTPLNMMNVAWPMLILGGLLIAVIYYLINIVRKEVRHASVFALLSISFFLIGAWLLNSNLFEDIYVSLAHTPQLQKYYFGAMLAFLVMVLLSLMFSIPLALAWGAGYPLNTRLNPNPLPPLELLLRGRVRATVVGQNIFTGLAIAAILPLSAMLVARSGFSGAELRGTDGLADVITARFPLFTLPSEPTTISLYVVLFLIVLLQPLVISYVGRPLLVRALGIIVGAICVSGSNFFAVSLPAALLSGLILMIVLDQLAQRTGILAVITAILAADYITRLNMLMNQPFAALQTTGIRGWLSLIAVMLLAGWVALRGIRLDEKEARAEWTTEAQRAGSVDRERLKAEFGVARRAQEQMLPEHPPDFPGFRIAAVCRPAREVGGDLYDFILLPDNRLGVVVADVSGKGVPASLYMTLTKGLLASVSEVSSDPGEILREVNKHLYIACGKKMFVTLLLGVLDADTLKFSYARAGHNPPVWRQRDGSETSLLRAPGIGLGLNSGEMFNRVLKVETIQLQPKDKLFIYSDGITEAMNAARDEYGEERLIDLAPGLDELSAEQTRDAILEDVSKFLGPTPPQDDQTLVVVEVC